MLRSALFVLAVCMVLAACGGQATPDTTLVAQAVQATLTTMPQSAPAEVTRVVEVEATRVVEVEATRIVQVEVTRLVEETREVVAQTTRKPEPTVSPTEVRPSSLVTWTVDTAQEEGGVRLQVKEVAILDVKDATPEFQKYVEGLSNWDGVLTYAVLFVEVTNTTSDTLTVHPDQGSIVVGDEQANADYIVSERIGGEIFAGVVKRGFVVFPLRRPVVTQTLDSLRYVVNAPNAENYRTIGNDYYLTIPLPPPPE